MKAVEGVKFCNPKMVMMALESEELEYEESADQSSDDSFDLER